MTEKTHPVDPAVIVGILEHGSWMRPRRPVFVAPVKSFICGCTELIPCSLHAFTSFYSEQGEK